MVAARTVVKNSLPSYALEHGVAGAVAQLNPGNATRGIKPPNAVGEKLSKSGVARSLLVERINHGWRSTDRRGGRAGITDALRRAASLPCVRRLRW